MISLLPRTANKRITVYRRSKKTAANPERGRRRHRLPGYIGDGKAREPVSSGIAGAPADLPPDPFPRGRAAWRPSHTTATAENGRMAPGCKRLTAFLKIPLPFLGDSRLKCVSFFGILNSYIPLCHRQEGTGVSCPISEPLRRRSLTSSGNTASGCAIGTKRGFPGNRRFAVCAPSAASRMSPTPNEIKGMLSSMGFALHRAGAEADLILFNTCAVREHAEDRVFGNVGALKNLKRRRPGLIIGLCGCMVPAGARGARKLRKTLPLCGSRSSGPTCCIACLSMLLRGAGGRQAGYRAAGGGRRHR